MMTVVQLVRDGYFSALAMMLAVLVYLYTTATSLPTPDVDMFPGDHLTPYSEHRHGSRRTVRDIQDCQHVTWENSTFEEFLLSPDPPDSTEVKYELHKFVDTIKGDYFRHKYLMGTIAFVENPYYTFSVLEPQNKGGCEKKYFTTTRSTVRQTIENRAQGCKLASNGGYFIVLNGQCLGNIVSDGRIVQTTDDQNANFGIREDGTITVGYIPSEEILNSTNPFRQLISGVIWLVRNGTNYVNESMRLECSSHEDTGKMETFVNVQSARTALGHDAQGRLVIAQVEGQTHKRGTDLYQFAELLLRHGVVNAINLDGGGSSTLVEDNVLLNYPSDHCFGAPEYRCDRAVSTVMCVHDVECLEPNCNGHGSCDSGKCSCDPLWIGEACGELNCSLADCSGHGNCSNGQCVCEAGWMGETCNQTCPDNLYGPGCTSRCYCWGKSHCNHLTGECVCPPGYHGFGCWQECAGGMFGVDCLHKCEYPECSGHGKCSHVNGSCLCEDGWEGVACNDTLGSGDGDIQSLLLPHSSSDDVITSTTTHLSQSSRPARHRSTTLTPSPTQHESAILAPTPHTPLTSLEGGNSSCVPNDRGHDTRLGLLLGLLLALLTLVGHAVLCVCTRRPSNTQLHKKDRRLFRRGTKPVKRRKLRKKKQTFVALPQESSSDCSI